MKQILHYLQEKPEAKDTFEGICQWWLTSTPNEQDSQHIQQALIELAEHKVLNIREVGLGQKIYGINKDNVQGIQDMLNTLHEH